VKYKLEPSLIITPAKADPKFLEALKLPFKDDQKEGAPVQTLKSQHFTVHNAKQKFYVVKHTLMASSSSVAAPSQSSQQYQQQQQFTSSTIGSETCYGERYLWGLSPVDIDENTQMLRAAGGLLSYMQENRIQFCAEEGDIFQAIKYLKHVDLYVLQLQLVDLLFWCFGILVVLFNSYCC